MEVDRKAIPPLDGRRSVRGSRPSIASGMLLIAGSALGCWIGTPMLAEGSDDMVSRWVATLTCVLGGISLVGPPLLLWGRFQRRDSHRRLAPAFGPGRLLWFTTGTSAWLLWPPIISARAMGAETSRRSALYCFLYGTPLMGLFLVLGLWASGWLHRSRRKRFRRYWTERVGFWLGVAWFAIGVDTLGMIYLTDLGGR
jgi:hypothetical protein